MAGNSALTAHVYDANGQPVLFVDLHKLGWGNQVIVHLLDKRYIYEVREVKQYLNPSATDNLKVQKEDPWLTLVTCQG